MWTSSQVASTIDHAALKPDMTNDDIRAAAALGRKYRTASVCVRPSDVALTASLLKDSGVKTCMVVGFPHGANRPEIKALEARLGIADGAEELDMVMNVGKFLSGDYDWVRRDIEGVVAEARRAGNVIVKVILETCYLSPEGIARACQIACDAGAVFVKTFDRIRIRRGHARGDRYHDQDGRPADGCEGLRRHPRFPDRLRVPGPGMHASWRRQHRRSAGRKRRCDGGVLRPELDRTLARRVERPVAGVAQSGHDELVRIQFGVDGRHVKVRLRIPMFDFLNAWSRSNNR